MNVTFVVNMKISHTQPLETHTFPQLSPPHKHKHHYLNTISPVQKSKNAYTWALLSLIHVRKMMAFYHFSNMNGITAVSIFHTATPPPGVSPDRLGEMFFPHQHSGCTASPIWPSLQGDEESIKLYSEKFRL